MATNNISDKKLEQLYLHLVIIANPTMIRITNPLLRSSFVKRAKFRRTLSSPPSSSSSASHAKSTGNAKEVLKTQGIGSGKSSPGGIGGYIKDRGPVSWPSLFLVGIAAASTVGYYNIERERRLEAAMGRVVSSESDGWTPNADTLAKRKFKLTPWGWFPEEDGFGACKSLWLCLSTMLNTRAHIKMSALRW